VKLRSIRLHGFKSFADRTEIQIHEGITSIVGPNGCGKSNIGDAIRWVLGEQRPSAIRGAKMEEAIFQGTVNRRPVNRGSVTMVVSNEDATLPVPFEEVEIGRTVYRDGGSDYSLNRAPCRLRDIHDLCRDTGLGANAYAVIESRMIDAILSDRAEERRSLFEEAAGIGKYKDRRKSAQRRLERADLDLQRLEDLIGEVESKVRSLARQKGKAQRYHRLRARRLAVEVAVVRRELDVLGSRLAQVAQKLAEDQVVGEGIAAQLGTAEARYESLRLQQVEAEKARSSAAERLEDVRARLSRWERDLAVADERAMYARRRIEQIDGERSERERRIGGLKEEEGGLAGRREGLEADFQRLSQEMEASQAAAREVRERLVHARQDVDEVERREREIARKVAQTQGDAEASEAQAVELGRRLERLERDRHEAADQLSDMESQGDLFSDRAESLVRAASEAEARVQAARSELARRRKDLERARASEVEALDRASALAAQLSALETLERDGEGLVPAVRSAQQIDDSGIVGLLSEFVSAPEGVARAVEAFLGPLLQGLVVRDRATVLRLNRWFEEEWSEGGGLILLPLDEVPKPEGVGSLFEALEASGEGAPWVRALLAEVELVDGDMLSSPPGSGIRISPSGTSVDRLGVVRIGAPSGLSGLIERRERTRKLRGAVGAAQSSAEDASSARASAEEAFRSAESSVEKTWDAYRVAVDDYRGAQAEVAAQDDRKVRTERQREDLDRQLEGTRAARRRALRRAEETRREREGLLDEARSLADEHGATRGRLDRALEEWETARSEESQSTIRLARLEGELARVVERQDELMRAQSGETSRIEELNRERGQLGQELERATQMRADGAVAMERLFGEQDEARGQLSSREEALASVAEGLLEAERQLRDARAAEREATNRRHRLELERQELTGRIERIRERLEAEWGRPLEVLLDEADEAEGEPEGLRAEYQELVAALERIGPVNMLAVEEHEEESNRLAFLREQRDDLVDARDDLRSAIREINQTATDLFLGTFEKIQENFQSTFLRLFQGGEANLWLSDPDDPLESPIEIHASPRGKRTQRIDLLSGGERALTALALLFGIYLVKPSPFCVLDEVDAPLDESNIGRFVRLLEEFKGQTQFVVITHNPRTIEAADWIYGVTMEEPGISTVVGVRLEEALQVSGSAA
jgi:chromosome segregation protein